VGLLAYRDQGVLVRICGIHQYHAEYIPESVIYGQYPVYTRQGGNDMDELLTVESRELLKAAASTIVSQVGKGALIGGFLGGRVPKVGMKTGAGLGAIVISMVYTARSIQEKHRNERR
jgi:hypothetical protein